MIVLLSTSDTDLLSARASGAGYRLGNPSRLSAPDVPALLDRASVVVVRILGGRRMWEDGLDAVLASGVPAVVLGGEQGEIGVGERRLGRKNDDVAIVMTRPGIELRRDGGRAVLAEEVERVARRQPEAEGI